MGYYYLASTNMMGILFSRNCLIEFEIPRKKRRHHKLCIGMATYDDGVYFSVQAIRCYHPEVAEEIGILVVDNHPDGAIAQELLKNSKN